ncbi:MAG: tripartite tricarboxylate transporter permease [Chloroflexota bacterium]
MDYLGSTLQIIGGILSNPMYWAALFATILLTGPIGLIPGVGATTLLVLTLPFVILNLDPLIGLVFIAGMLSLGNTMDIIPAVLLGYPSGSTAVDFLEGHQLARRGLGARVLGASYAVSMIGGVIGATTLALTLPGLRAFIVNFSYAEIAAMALFGVSMVAILSRGSVMKGLGSAILGLLIASIGVLPITGFDRFTFGNLYLWDGIPLVAFLLGVFAFPELVDLTMSKQPVAANSIVSNREVWEGFKEGLQRWRTIPRQSLFGVFMGSIPGIGGATIEWLSYALGIAFSKDKSQFGKGSLDGILFTESAQSAKEAGQAIPTLAFGIPGGSSWALCLAAMVSYGIAPGLGMLTTNLNITMGIVLTIGLGNLIGAFMALFISAQVAKLTLIPYTFVAGMMLPLMFLSAFQSRFQIGDILVLLSIGMLGLALKWFGWPRPPMIIAFVLAPVLEQNLWTAIGVNGPAGLLSRPYAITILILAGLTAVYLTRMMDVSERRALASVSDPLPEPVPARVVGGAVDTLEADKPNHELRTATTRHYRWKWEYLFWAGLLAVVGGVFLRESLTYEGASRFFPFWASIAFLLVMTTLIAKEVINPNRDRGEVMDIAMRTGTDTAAVWALARILGWIGGFVLAMGTFGLQITAILFPILFIPANIDWRGRKLLWVLIPVALSAFVVLGILDGMMHVVWPDRFVLNWFSGGR